MIIHDVEQGSTPWYNLRIGIPTASEFDNLITPKGKPTTSERMRRYAYRLIAEKLLMRSMESLDGLKWIEHGKTYEDEAARAYEFEYDTPTVRVGFITTDDGEIGASPDRLIGDDGLLEIKCVAPQTQVKYFAEGFGDEYMPQAQGQLYVAENRKWVERFSYNPEFPNVICRAERDEGFIGDLRIALEKFNELRLDLLERIQKTGFFLPRAEVIKPLDAELAQDPARYLNAG